MKKLLYLLLLLPFVTMAADKIAEVEFDTNSVILKIDLYDKTNPEDCPSTDLTHGTQDLNITISDDVTDGILDFFECTGAACVTTDTIEDITTLGTFVTPSANNVRFKVQYAGGCQYQLQFADAIFETVGSNRIDIEITAPGIIAKNGWVDLTPVSLTTLVAAVWDELTAGNIGAGSFGAQLKTVLDTVNTLLGTVDSKVTALQTDMGYFVILEGIVDVGTTTSLDDTDTITQADHFWNNATAVRIGSNPPRCIRGTDNVNNRISWDRPLQAAASGSYAILYAPTCRHFP